MSGKREINGVFMITFGVVAGYALVCNGGVLLVNGERDKEWYYESLKMIAESRPQLDKAIGILEVDPRRKFEVRFIDELFVLRIIATFPMVHGSSPHFTIAIKESCSFLVHFSLSILMSTGLKKGHECITYLMVIL